MEVPSCSLGYDVERVKEVEGGKGEGQCWFFCCPREKVVIEQLLPTRLTWRSGTTTGAVGDFNDVDTVCVHDVHLFLLRNPRSWARSSSMSEIQLEVPFKGGCSGKMRTRAIVPATDTVEWCTSVDFIDAAKAVECAAKTVITSVDLLQWRWVRACSCLAPRGNLGIRSLPSIQVGQVLLFQGFVGSSPFGLLLRRGCRWFYEVFWS